MSSKTAETRNPRRQRPFKHISDGGSPPDRVLSPPPVSGPGESRHSGKEPDMAYGYLTQSTWLRNMMNRSRSGTGSMVFDAERRAKGGNSPERQSSDPGMTASRDIHRIG